MVEKGDFKSILGDQTHEFYNGLMKALQLEKQLKPIQKLCKDPIEETRSIMQKGFKRKRPDVQEAQFFELLKVSKRGKTDLEAVILIIEKEIIPCLEKVTEVNHNLEKGFTKRIYVRSDDSLPQDGA